MVEIKIKNDSEQFIKQFKDDINKYAKFYEDGSGPWWGFESTWLIDKMMISVQFQKIINILHGSEYTKIMKML